MPISRDTVEASGSVEKAQSDQRLGNALTGVVLYTITVELVIKHLWEKEKGSVAKPTHNILALFLELSPETQNNVRRLYDESAVAYEAAVAEGIKQLGPKVMSVSIASLEDALEWNADAIRNFKYDLTPKRQSVPTGMFWTSETMWVAPGNMFNNFAVALTRWARAN